MDTRRNKIVEFVNQNGMVTTAELKEAFPQVSDVTLRKDLQYLDSTLQLIRIHGGAKSIPAALGKADDFFVRASINTESKKLIAQRAVTLLKPNNALFISAGTSCNEFVKVLPDFSMQVFTDGLATALELASHPNVETTVLGNELDPQALRLQGQRVFEDLTYLHFDYAFFGTDGYRPEYGFVCFAPHYANLLHAVRQHTDKMVILMDKSKFNASRAARNFPAKMVDIVVTDGQFDPSAIRSLQQTGISVL